MAMPIALVVDKDVAVCRSICAILQTAGIQWRQAQSAAEAAQALRDSAIDLLFTALKLSDRDGISLIADADLLRPGIAVVVVTHDTSPESIVQALRLGVRDYVFKPVSPQKILTALERARSGDRRSIAAAATKDENGPDTPTELIAKSQTVTLPLGGDLRSIERQLVKEVIWRCDGNKAAAARTLGMHRRTLYRMLAQGSQPAADTE